MGLTSGGLEPGGLRNVTEGLVPSDAIPSTLIDNFEEPLYEEKNNTLSDYYSGDTGSHTRQQTTVKEGSYALKRSSNALRRQIVSSSLNALLDQGETMRVWVREDNDQGRIGVAFFAQDTGNYYWAAMERQNNELRLFKVSGGNRSQLSSTSLSANSGTWYELEVNPQTDNTINVALYDDQGTQLASLSHTDSSYTDGGFGFATNEGGSSNCVWYWDNARITDGGSGN